MSAWLITQVKLHPLIKRQIRMFIYLETHLACAVAPTSACLLLQISERSRVASVGAVLVHAHALAVHVALRGHATRRRVEQEVGVLGRGAHVVEEREVRALAGRRGLGRCRLRCRAVRGVVGGQLFGDVDDQRADGYLFLDVLVGQVDVGAAESAATR